MSARTERDKVDMNHIGRILEGCPNYLKTFSQSLDAEGKTPRTIQSYIIAVQEMIKYMEQHEYLTDIDSYSCFASLKPMHMNEYFMSMKKSASTKNARYYGIKCFFRFLYDNEFLEKNIMDKVKIKPSKDVHEIVYLEQKEIKQIFKDILKDKAVSSFDELDVFGMRDYLIIALGIHTGMRRGSMIEIEINDIDLENCELSIIQKGDRAMKVELGEHTVALMEKYMVKRFEYLERRGMDTKAFFITNQCGRLSNSGMAKIVRKWADVFPNKKITPHKLRSTCATNLYSQTGDIYLTASRLGHSNINTTQRYAAVTKERSRKATSLNENNY